MSKKNKNNAINIEALKLELLVIAGDLEDVSCDIDGIDNLLGVLKYGLFNEDSNVNEYVAHSIFDVLCKSLHQISEKVIDLQDQTIELKRKVGEAS